MRLVHILLSLSAAAAAMLAVAGAGSSTPGQRLLRLDQPELEQPIFIQINETRREHGLPPLARSAQLTAAARAHARSLALTGQFRHEWPDGTPFGRWMQRFYPVAGSHTWSVGENLLWSSGSIDAKQAVAMWLASPPHRRIIFTPNWRQLGIGVVDTEHAPGAYGGHDVVIVSADFGARS